MCNFVPQAGSRARVRGVSILAMYLYYIIYMRWVLLSYYQNVDRSPWVLPVLSYYQVSKILAQNLFASQVYN